jgi:hypothetical protein
VPTSGTRDAASHAEKLSAAPFTGSCPLSGLRLGLALVVGCETDALGLGEPAPVVHAVVAVRASATIPMAARTRELR